MRMIESIDTGIELEDTYHLSQGRRETPEPSLFEYREVPQNY